MGILDVLRTTLLDDPRASRAFVTGAADVLPTDVTFGTGGDWTPSEYASYIATSNGVYACVNARTKALRRLPLRLYDGVGDKRKEVTTGPARELLDRVNPYWTFGRWLDMTEQALCVWGESFSFYATQGRRPVELWWAPADRVTVHPDPENYISHFIYEVNGKRIRFEREETLWLHYPNVNNQWEGLSPLAAARLAADTASAAAKSNYRVFTQGLTAAGMVVPQQGQNLTEDQARAVANDLNKRFTGASNAHKVAVLRFNVDVKSLSMTPKDAEFVASMNLSLEDIARAYAVPIDKVGGKRTYQNVEDSEKVFWNDCILPEAQFIAEEITEQLLPLLGRNLTAEFDDSEIDVLHEAETALWEREMGQLDRLTITINEWRADHGLEPVPWGDVVWMDGSKVPIEGPEKPAAPIPPALAASAGQDDDQQEDDEDEQTPPPPDNTERIRTRVIEYDSSEHRAAWSTHVDRTDTWETRIGNATADLMRDQRQSVLATLRGRSRSAEAVALDPFDRSRWIKTFRVKMRPLVAGVTEEAGEFGLDDLGIDFGFNVKDPDVLRAIETQVQRFAEDVNETTWNTLRDSIRDGIDAGEGIDALAERVDAVMGDRIKSSKEAIARTESTRASTNGTLASWQQSGVVTGKRWLAAIDARTRETHRAAHGQEVAIDANFTVGGATGPGPGSMSSAKESVNCRCSMEPVLDVEDMT